MVLVHNYIEQDFVHLLVVVERCLAVEAVASAEVELRYVTLILEIKNKN